MPLTASTRPRSSAKARGALSPTPGAPEAMKAAQPTPRTARPATSPTARTRVGSTKRARAAMAAGIAAAMPADLSPADRAKTPSRPTAVGADSALAVAPNPSSDPDEGALDLDLELAPGLVERAGPTRSSSPEQDATDRAQALAAAAGDAEAWRALYQRWSRDLGRYGHSLGWDGELVQDLVQDTLFRAWEKRESYNPQYPYRVWILTIFRRIAVSQFRRSRTHARAVQQDPAVGTTSAPWWAEGSTDMAASLEQANIREALAPVLASLRPEDVQLLQAWAHDVQQGELAVRLAVNPVTLRTKILRAKKRLRAAFVARYPEMARSGWDDDEE